MKLSGPTNLALSSFLLITILLSCVTDMSLKPYKSSRSTSSSFLELCVSSERYGDLTVGWVREGIALIEHKEIEVGVEVEEVEEGSGCNIAIILAGVIGKSITDSEVSTDCCSLGKQSGEILNLSFSSRCFLCELLFLYG